MECDGSIKMEIKDKNNRCVTFQKAERELTLDCSEKKQLSYQKKLTSLILLSFAVVLSIVAEKSWATDSTYVTLDKINKLSATFEVVYRGENSGVSVLDFVGNYDREIGGVINTEARQAVTQELYQNLPDQYDFIVIFTDFPVDSGNADAFAISYQNDVQGIGLPVFNNSSLMSSEKLQATIDMTEITDWELNSGKSQFDTTLDTLIHEMMHRWGVAVRFQDNNNQPSDLLLGRDNIHWNYFMSSNASVMYGALWEEVNPGQFETKATRKSLSPLDLYLMGFLAPAAVPDFFLVENGLPGDREDIPPPVGTQVSGNRLDISIDDIVAVEGPRIPDHINSQHEFNVKFVLLQDPAQPFNSTEFGSLLVLQREFKKRFFAETEGLGEVHYPEIELSAGAGDPESLTYSTSNNSDVNLDTAKNFLIAGIANNHWQDKSGSKVRDTALAVRAMAQLGETTFVEQATQWLNDYQAVNNDELAWQILSDKLNAVKKQQVIDQLLNNINSDGGWGLAPDSESSVMDTVLVLKSLKVAAGDAFSVAASSKLYLMNSINSDGGVGYGVGGKSAFSSSARLLTIVDYITQDQSIKENLGQFIVAKQHVNGAFGSGEVTVHETALAISALRGAGNQSYDQAIADAQTKLTTMQSLDGSFEGSFYSTALALEALHNDQNINVSLDSATPSNDRPVAGEQVSIEFFVSNLGESDETEVTIGLYNNQELLTTATIPVFAANSTANTFMILDTTNYSGELGLTVRVDHENLIVESNENDNEGHISIEVLPVTATPELVIQAGSVSYQPHSFDRLPFDVSVDFKVANLSSQALTAVPLQLVKNNEDGSVGVLSATVADFLPGQEHLFNLGGQVGFSQGDVSLSVHVDQENSHLERNELNNSYNLVIKRNLSIDLSISAADVMMPSQWTQGFDQEVSFVVNNRGTADVPPFNIQVFLDHAVNDSVLLYENHVVALEAGASLTRSFSWTPESIDEYSMRFIVDHGNVISETNESNNQASIPVTVNANSLVNLSVHVDDVMLLPLPGLAGEPFTVSVDVVNDSSVPSPGFDISLSYQYPDQPITLIESLTELSLAANSSREVQWTIDPLTLNGEATLIIHADPDNAVNEFNENDNIAIKPDIRFLSLPDARVINAGVGLSPSEPVPGQPLMVTVAVDNLGEQNINNLSVKLYTIDEDTGGQQFVAENQLAQLPPGESRVTQFNFVLSDAETTEQLKVVVDELNDVAEGNELNNETLINFDRQDSQFYLTEKYISPNGDGIKDTTRIAFNFDVVDDYKMKIYDPHSRLVRAFDETLTTSATYGEWLWDGRDNVGKVVKDGLYLIRLDGLSSGYTKFLNVYVDTNRSGLLSAMSQGKGHIYDLGCVINYADTGAFSEDGKYLIVGRYDDKQGFVRKGLFKIKTDGSEVVPLLSDLFLQNRTIGSFRVINSGQVIFLAHELGSQKMYQLDLNSLQTKALLSHPLDQFQAKTYGRDSAVVFSQTIGNEGHFQIFYDALRPAEEMAVGLDHDHDDNFFELDNGWLLRKDLTSASGYEYHYLPKYDIENAVLLTPQGGEGHYSEHQISKDASNFVINGFEDIVWYGSEADNLREIKRLTKNNQSITDEKPTLSPYNELLIFSDGELALYDDLGNVKFTHSNPYNLQYFQDLIIQRHGSLNGLVFNNGESGRVVYDFDDLTDLRINPGLVEEVAWVSPTEVYVSYQPRLVGKLQIERFGSAEISFESPAPEYIKIDYANLHTIEITELDRIRKVSNDFIEPDSYYFLADEKIYLKGADGEAEPLELNFPEGFSYHLDSPGNRHPRFEKTTSIVKKLRIQNYSGLNQPLRCTPVGEDGDGFYQPTTNLTAFVSAKFSDDQVHISGSAFDQNFSHYRLEYKNQYAADNTWHPINSGEFPKIDELFQTWTPVVSGSYFIRLTVYDLAGNQLEDVAQVFVPSSNISIRNVAVSPEFFSPNGDGIKDQALIEFDVVGTTELAVQIRNSNGEVVRSFLNQYLNSGHEQLVWDGLNDAGEALPSGQYQVVFSGYRFSVVLDVSPPQAFVRDYSVNEEVGNWITFDLSQALSYYKDPWEIKGGIDGLDYSYEYYDDTGSWISLGREQFVRVTPFNVDEIITNRPYRIKVIDYAGNIGVSEAYHFTVDKLYVGELRKKDDSKTVQKRVLKACDPEESECEASSSQAEIDDCALVIHGRICNKEFYKFTQQIDEDLFNQEVNQEMAFVVQTFSPQEVGSVVLEFNYVQGQGVDQQVHTIEVVTEPADVVAVSDYFDEADELTTAGLPEGMVKFRSERNEIHAYVLIVDQNMLLDFVSQVPFVPDLIQVDAKFVNYVRSGNHELAFQFTPAVPNINFFASVKSAILSDDPEAALQAIASSNGIKVLSDDFLDKFYLARDAIEQASLDQYDYYLWRYGPFDEYETSSHQIRVEYPESISDDYLRPIFSRQTDGTSFAELYAFNKKGCYVASEATWLSSQKDISIELGSNDSSGICLLDDHNQQYFKTQDYCNPQAEQDDLIRLNLGGTFRFSDSQLVSMEAYRLVDGQEVLLYATTDPTPQPGEDGLFYGDTFTLNKADYAEGEYQYFVRYTNLEGHQAVESYTFLVQKENISPQVISPDSMASYCAAEGDETARISVPYELALSNNASHALSIRNVANNQLVGGVDDFVYNDHDFVSKLTYSGGSSSVSFSMPYFSGQTSLVFETINSTGVSSCDVVAVNIDSLVDVVVRDNTGENIDSNAISYPPTYVSSIQPAEYNELTANEQVAVEVDLYHSQGNALDDHITNIQTFTANAGVVHGLSWDGMVNGTPVTDGVYFIVLTITDGCGLVKTLKNKIVVDNTSPELSFSQPVNGQSVSTLTEVEAEVLEGNIDTVELDYQVNGSWAPIVTEVQPIVERPEFDLVTGLWNLSGLINDTYPLRLTVKDLAGNENTLTISVNLTEQQNIFWSYLLTPRYVSPNNDGEQDRLMLDFGLNLNAEVSITVTDVNQNEVKQLLLNESLPEGAHQLIWDGTDNSGQVVIDGEYHLVATATEIGNVGNSQSLSLKAYIDTTPPVVTVTPSNSVIKGQGSMALNLLENNPAQLSAWLQPADLFVPEIQVLNADAVGDFNLFLLTELEETSYELKVLVQDKAGNQLLHTHQFKVDNNPPVLNLEYPKDISFQGMDGQLHVIGNITDDNFHEYQLFISPDVEPPVWQELTTGDELIEDQFMFDWPITVNDGVYLFRALAVDQAGWETEAVHQVTLDTQPPVVVLNHPVNQSLQGQTITIKGTVTDPNLSFYHLSYRRNNDPDNQWHLIHSGIDEINDATLYSWTHGLDSGNYEIRLLAQDQIGLRAETVVEFMLDTTAPEPALYLNAERVNGNDVQLNWQPSVSGDVIGYQIYRNNHLLNQNLITQNSYQDLSLPDGEFTYWVLAVDGANNISHPSNSQLVVVDTTAPEVFLLKPTNGQLASGIIDVVGTVNSTDDFKVMRLYYRLATDPAPGLLIAQSTLPVAGEKLAELDTSSLIQGADYLIRMEAEDLSGNLATVERRIRIDNVPPAAPVNLTYQLANGNDVTLNWQANSETDLAGYLVYRNGEIISGNGTIQSSIITDISYLDEDVVDGNHEYFIVTVDLANNASANSNIVQVNIDQRPPDVQFVTPADGHEFEAPLIVIAASDDVDVASVVFDYSTDAVVWQVLETRTQRPYEVLVNAQDLNLSFGDVLYLRATATDLGGQTDATPAQMMVEYTDLTPPAAVMGLSGSVTGGEIQLNWLANSEADLAGYLVARKRLEPDPESEYTVLTGSATTANQYLDSDLADGTYQYQIKAVDTFDNLSVAVDSEIFKVFSIKLAQPYSPLLAPVVLEVSGETAHAGEIQLQLINASGSQDLPTILADADGGFTVGNLTLTVGDNQMTAYQETTQGDRSRTESVAVQLSPVPLTPSNPTVSVNGYDVDFSWEQPEPGVFGYLPYINQQPVFVIEPYTSGLIATASSNTSSAHLALDGMQNTYWSPSYSDRSDGIPVFFEIQLPESKWITQVDITWNQGFYGVNKPDQYLLQFSSPVGWITQADFSGNENVTASFSGEQPYLTDKIRVLIPVGTYTPNFELSEVKIWHQPLTDQLNYIATLTDGNYDLQVSAVNSYGFASDLTSVQNGAVGDTTPPDPVVLDGQIQNGNQVTLGWTASTSADVNHYRLFRNNELIFISPDASTLTHLDTDLPNGHYTYRVAVVDVVGNVSLMSNEVTIEVSEQVLTAPTGMSISAPERGGTLRLEWNAHTAPTFAYFKVYRSLQSDGSFEVITQLSEPVLIDTNLTNGVSYYYYLTAVDELGNESLPSTVAVGTPKDLIIPAKPVITRPTDVGLPITVNENNTDVGGYSSPGVLIDLFHNDNQIGFVRSTVDYSQDNHDFGRLNMREVQLSKRGLFAYRNINQEIIIYDPDQETFTPLNGDNLSHHFWNEAGTVLYAIHNSYGNSELKTFGLDGQEIDSVYLGFVIRDVTRSPDAGQLFYEGDGINSDTGQSESGLWLYALADNTHHKIDTNGAVDIKNNAVSWLSSDRLAFIDFHSDSLWLYDIQSDQLQELESNIYGTSQLAASKDGTHLYYSVRENGDVSVRRYNISDGATKTYTIENSDVSLPVVDNDIDLILVSVNCCSKQLINMETGEVIHHFNDIGSRSNGVWLDASRAMLVGGDKLVFLDLPGVFNFEAISLQAGLNQFYAVARKENGLVSPVSETIEVILNENTLPDLEIKPDYLQISASQVLPDNQVTGSVLIKNSSAQDVEQARFVIELTAPDLTTQVLAPTPIDFSLVANEVLRENFVITGLSQTGEYTIRVVADSNQQVTEINENNNSVVKTVRVVEDLLPDLNLVIDNDLLYPGQQLSGEIQVYNPGSSFDGTVNLEITDDTAYPVGFTQTYTINELSDATLWQQDINWDSATVFAGNYQIHAELFDQNGQQLETQSHDFSISALADFDMSLSANAAQVELGEALGLQLLLNYASGNTNVSGTLHWEVYDVSEQLVWSESEPLDDMLPGFETVFENSWLSQQQGTFEVRARLETELDTAHAVWPFVVVPPASILDLRGEIQDLPAAVQLGQTATINYQVSNAGTVDTPNVPVTLTLWDNQLTEVVEQQAATVSLLRGDTQHLSVNWTSNIWDLGHYVLTLTADLSQYGGSASQILANQTLTTMDTQPPVVQIESPVEGGFYPSSVNLIANITDQWHDIEQVLLDIDAQGAGSGEGSISLYSAPQSNLYQRWLTELAEGVHQIRVRAWDEAGNQADVSRSFIVDTTSPLITVTGIIDDGLYNSQVQAHVQVTDTYLDTINMTLNGQPYQSGELINSEGSHLLQVTATDLAGNTSTTRLVFYLDLTAPVVNFTYPQNNSETNQPTTLVSGLTEVGATLTLQTGSYTDTVTADYAGIFSFADVPLISGANLITVSAVDLAGNPGVPTLVTVELVDTISVTGTLTAGSSHPLGQNLTVNWQLNNLNDSEVSQLPVKVELFQVVDNQLVGSDEQTIDIIAAGTHAGSSVLDTDTLMTGDHRLQLSVQTEQGWQNLDDSLITMQDQLGPVVTVIEPTHGELSNTELELLVQAVDEHSDVAVVAYQLDNSNIWEPMNWNGINYTASLELSHGSHQLLFRAIDDFNNESQSTVVTVNIDTMAPDIQINQPTDGLITNQPVTVDFVVSDDHDFSVAAQLDTNEINNGHTINAEGVYLLDVTATDQVNNESTVRHSFTIDTTIPVLTVSNPLDGEQNTKGVVDVVGLSEVRNQVLIKVNGTETTVKTDQDGRFISVGHALQLGQNIIEVTATDQAGNNSNTITREVEFIQSGQVRGRIWQDVNGDGIIDATETGFNQVWLKITNDQNQEWKATTDMMGYYVFEQLPVGAYTIEIIDQVLLNDWQQTTDNLIQQLEVEADQTINIDFGFRRIPSQINGQLTANSQRGRLLMLLDPATAQINANKCFGVSQWRMQAVMNHEFITGDVVSARLYDVQGNLLQTETASYEDFINNGYQVIDQQGETTDFNLLLHPVTGPYLSATVTRSSTAAPAILPEAYRLILSLQSGNKQNEWSGEVVSNNCQSFYQIGEDIGDLQLTDVRVYPPLVSDEPNGVTTMGSMSSQRVLLENLLREGGWSYEVVTDANAFSAAMATDQYVAYWLLAENVQLTNQTQNDLITAMHEGAALVVSSGHDNLNTQFYSAMGVQVTGSHLNATEFELFNTAMTNAGTLEVGHNEHTLKASLSGAESVGVFRGADIEHPDNQALTLLQSVGGKAVFSGLDWLLQATESTGLNTYLQLIQQVLEYTHPLGLATELGRARAVRLSLENQSLAVNGHVQVLLPPGVNLIYAPMTVTTATDGFAFVYQLAENQHLEFEFWVEVNDSPADLRADVYVDHTVEVIETLELTLIAGEKPDLTAAISNCVTGVKPQQELTYHYQITNNGNTHINNALAYTGLPTTLLNPQWQCSATAGAVCGAASGSGNLLGQVIDLPVGSTVSYYFTAQVATHQPIDNISVSARVVMPDEATDINPFDNDAIDIDQVYPFLFKDGFECMSAGAAYFTTEGK